MGVNQHVIEGRNRRMKRMIVSLLAVCMVAVVIATAGATSKSQPDMLILYMPFHHSVGALSLDHKGQLHGTRLQILKLLNRELKPMGIQLRYRITKQGELPISRCIDALAQNQYQAYLALGVSPERVRKGIQYSQVPLLTVPNVLWMLKKHVFPFEGLSSLKGKRIGVIQGSPILTKPELESELILDRSAPTPANNVRKLLHGRLDAIVGTLSSTGTTVLEMGVQDQIEFCLTCLPSSDAYIGYSPSVPVSVRKQIDRAIETLRISGEIQQTVVGKVLNQLRKSAVNSSK